MIAVGQVGINRVLNVVRILTDVQDDPFLKHFKGIPAVNGRFMQTIQRIETGRTESHEQKTGYSVGNNCFPDKYRLITLFPFRGILIPKRVIVQGQSCDDHPAEDQDQNTDQSADLVHGVL